MMVVQQVIVLLNKYNFCHIESALLTEEMYINQKAMCVKLWIQKCTQSLTL